jgi:alpha-ribazole phosphatase/probable phosphoglycerate mutase
MEENGCYDSSSKRPEELSTIRLILIRHAHTPSNGALLLGGRTDVALSPRGFEELHWLENGLRGASSFDAIYTSPLRRALETTAALKRAGLGPVYECPSLREIDCGALDGMPLEQIRCTHPGLWATNQRQMDDRFRWPGGESYREFRSRCLTALRTLARRHNGGRVALVTHAGVIGQLVGFLAGTTAAQWERFRPGHLALSELEWERGRGTVIRFDDRTHLPV